jgi:glucose/arabinose dehydrogenase
LRNPPRAAWATPEGEVLAVERAASPARVSWWRDGGVGGAGGGSGVVVSQAGLNHGLAVRGGFVYASSDTTVYRWRLARGADGTLQDSSATVEVVLRGISADGAGGAPRGHTTRTLVFDDAGRLYVSVGSAANVDADSYRSRVRRLTLPEPLPAGGVDFATAEVFADGLRNEVGLAFDRHGQLWGVENGADQVRSRGRIHSCCLHRDVQSHSRTYSSTAPTSAATSTTRTRRRS